MPGFSRTSAPVADRLAVGLATLLVGVLAAPGGAHADGAPIRAHVSARSGALADELQAWDGTLLPRRRLVQELSFAAYHDSHSRRGSVALVGTLRVEADFGLGGAEAKSLEPAPPAGLHVPICHLRVRDPGVGAVVAGVGRQVLWGAAQMLLLDGVALELDHSGPLGFAAFAGTLVRREISFAGLDELGPAGPALAESHEPTFGGSLFLRDVRWLDLGVGYRQDRAEGHRVRSVVAAQSALRPHAVAGLHLRWAHDLVWQRDERAGVALRGELPAGFGYAVEWERWQPSFAADSVFAVFGALPEQRLSARANLRRVRWQAGVGSTLICRDAGCGDAPWDLAGIGDSLGIAADAFASLRPSARWGLFGRGSTTLRGSRDGRHSLALGGRLLPAWAGASVEGQLRWVHLDGDVGPWARGEIVALDLSAAVRVWERARLMAVLQQAHSPTRPWWAKALLLLDMEYWL